jgi:hypothetical protein
LRDHRAVLVVGEVRRAGKNGVRAFYGDFVRLAVAFFAWVYSSFTVPSAFSS